MFTPVLKSIFAIIAVVAAIESPVINAMAMFLLTGMFWLMVALFILLMFIVVRLYIASLQSRWAQYH